jgi:hypothetical protein
MSTVTGERRDATRPTRRKKTSGRDRQRGSCHADSHGRNHRGAEHEIGPHAKRGGRSQGASSGNVRRRKNGDRPAGGNGEVVKMSNEAIQKEIDQNLEFFTKKLPDILKDHRNRYVLLHNKSISGIYDTIRDAQTAGDRLYPDKLYSIQQVTDSAINLGYFSYADCVG